MDLLKLKYGKRKVNTVNGCSIYERTSEGDELGFSSHIIKVDETNLLGYEYNWNQRIRIDAIQVDSKEKLNKLLDTLILIGRSLDYECMYIAEHISDEVFAWLLAYGFEKVICIGDSYNRHMQLSIQ